MEYIEQALNLAKRSGLKKHKTGCVIADEIGIVSTGWSHYSDLRLAETYTLHAELHAIFSAYKYDLDGASIYVACFSAKSKNPCCAKPCDVCLPAIKEVGIKKITYTISADGELKTEEIDL